MADDKDDEQTTQNDTFVTQLQSFASSTSLHAVKYVSEATRHRRIIWILVTLAVTIAFLVQFMMSLQIFFRYDTFTNMEWEEREELTLPSLTICNTNAIKRSAVEEGDPAMVTTFQQLMQIIYGLQTNSTLTRPESMKRFAFLDFYKKAAHQQGDFFLWCSIGKTVVNCSDYITEVVTTAGHCYTFNSKESIGKHGNLTMTEPGPYDGINLILDTEPDDYLIMNGFGVGIRFIMHEPDTLPLVNSGSYFAGPGQEVFFSITKTQTTHLPPPYSAQACIADEDLVQKGEELKLGAPYSEEACATVCYFSGVYDCPHCSVTGNGKPKCTLYDSLQCGADQGITNQRDRTCDCPRKCQSTSFSATNFHTNIPSPFILQMAENYNWPVKEMAEIQRRLILLRVYFDTMSITKVTQKASVTLIETLADIGGTFGLYLGASFVTIIEFADFLAVFLVNSLKSNKAKRRRPKANMFADSKTIHKFSCTNVNGIENEEREKPVTPLDKTITLD